MSPVAARRHVARDPATVGATPATRGQRAADALAAFGGAWSFVDLLGAKMFGWAAVGGALLRQKAERETAA